MNADYDTEPYPEPPPANRKPLKRFDIELFEASHAQRPSSPCGRGVARREILAMLGKENSEHATSQACESMRNEAHGDASREILAMLGKEKVASTSFQFDGANAQKDDDVEEFSMDEQILCRMELRDSILSGFDERNKETFSQDGGLNGWSFQENVLANERLAVCGSTSIVHGGFAQPDTMGDDLAAIPTPLKLLKTAAAKQSLGESLPNVMRAEAPTFVPGDDIHQNETAGTCDNCVYAESCAQFESTRNLCIQNGQQETVSEGQGNVCNNEVLDGRAMGFDQQMCPASLPPITPAPTLASAPAPAPPLYVADLGASDQSPAATNSSIDSNSCYEHIDGCGRCGHRHQSAAKFCIICGEKRHGMSQVAGVIPQHPGFAPVTESGCPMPVPAAAHWPTEIPPRFPQGHSNGQATVQVSIPVSAHGPAPASVKDVVSALIEGQVREHIPTRAAAAQAYGPVPILTPASVIAQEQKPAGMAPIPAQGVAPADGRAFVESMSVPSPAQVPAHELLPVQAPTPAHGPAPASVKHAVSAIVGFQTSGSSPSEAAPRRSSRPPGQFRRHD